MALECLIVPGLSLFTNQAEISVQYICASVELVAEIVERENLDIDKTGVGEISLAHKTSLVDALKEDAAFMAKNFGAREVFVSKEELVERGLNSPELHAGVAEDRADPADPGR